MFYADLATKAISQQACKNDAICREKTVCPRRSHDEDHDSGCDDYRTNPFLILIDLSVITLLATLQFPKLSSAYYCLMCSIRSA